MQPPYNDPNIEAKHERFESLPEPVQRRVFELMAALTGALYLPEAKEASQPETAPTEPTSLDDYRAQKEQVEKLSAQEEAQLMVNRVFEEAA